MCETKTGIIILGHGSRRAEANQEVLKIADKLKKKHQNLAITAAYAEFAEPNLEKAVELLADSAVEQVIIVPLFLTVGNHLHRDIPERVERLQAAYPQMFFQETNHLGADDLIVQLVEKRIKETVMNNWD